MKLKMGFITNSSSTSFILVCDDSFSIDMLSKAMGIERDSPLYIMVEKLYKKITDEAEKVQQVSEFDHIKISKCNLDKINNFISRGKKIYMGSIRSEDEAILSFFCMDAFEVEGDDFYLNYIKSSW